MLKAMLFIDGSWLYHVRPFLMNLDGRPEFELDYKALPMLVKDHLMQQTENPVDLVRTYYFGMTAVNKPGHDNVRERQFYEMLNKRCQYHTEVYEFDFRSRENGRRENCLEVGLTSMAMLHAMQPGTFDVACILAGDSDYQPMLRQIRTLGKRTQLVAVKGDNGFYPTHPRLLEDSNLFDYPPVFLDEHLDRLQYHRSESMRTCDSCGKEEMTAFTSDWFYCRSCREEYRSMKSRQQAQES